MATLELRIKVRSVGSKGGHCQYSQSHKDHAPTPREDARCHERGASCVEQIGNSNHTSPGIDYFDSDMHSGCTRDRARTIDKQRR
jgi:hypothetical protein